MLDAMLAQRNLLPIMKHDDGAAVTLETWRRRRLEMLRALQTDSYGITPSLPSTVCGEILRDTPIRCSNHASLQEIHIHIETIRGAFTYPIWLYLPKQVVHPPVLLYLALRDGVPKASPPVRDQPVEEILTCGYALVALGYTDVMNDNHYGDFEGGLAEYFGTSVQRTPTEWGKIGM